MAGVYEVKPGYPDNPFGFIFVCSDCYKAKYKNNPTAYRVNLKNHPCHRKQPCHDCGKPMTRR